jgi:hypothetical protein
LELHLINLTIAARMALIEGKGYSSIHN